MFIGKSSIRMINDFSISSFSILASEAITTRVASATASCLCSFTHVSHNISIVSSFSLS